MRSVIFLLLAVALFSGESSLSKNGVTVTVSVERDAGGPVLVAVFKPREQTPPLHLYSKDLPADGLGKATTLALAPGAPAKPRGTLTADQAVHVVEGLPVYPENTAVTLRLPITAPAGRGQISVSVLVSYMACSSGPSGTCLPIVEDAPLTVLVDGNGEAPVPTTSVGGPSDPAAIRDMVRSELAAAEQRLRQAWRDDLRTATEPTAIRWQRVATKADVEGAIREAHAVGKAALLDFTGPSCVNCQLLAKTVLRVPQVIRAWNEQFPIEVNTDPPFQDLAAWQQERFKTQNRPLYIRIAPDGSEARWDRVFDPTDGETMGRFLAFIRSGTAGDHSGTGGNLSEFIWLAILGGLFTLVMPCTYPMIPFTINAFAKQATAGRKLLPLALAYGAGIIACFVGVGVIVTGVFGASLTSLAGHPITNLLIAVMFAVLGLSLMGAFFLRPPAWMNDLANGSRGGYLGALLMGLTFAITAFTCTAPFAGAVLAAGVTTGAWGAAVGGMAIYSAVIAIPFVFLALSPGWLQKLPRAGAWMNEFKVVGGLIEIAAAFKFLVICDLAWHWGMIGRTSTLVIWSAIALACATYLMGWWRHEGDDRVEHVGVGRLCAGLVFTALAIWLAAGLAGVNLGIIETFFPE
mgnify:CR=1 FL=1